MQASCEPAETVRRAKLRRPARNATGAYQSAGDGLRRRAELLRQVIPAASRIGLLLDRRSTEFARQRQLHEDAVRAMAGVQLEVAEFTNFEAVARQLANLRREGVEAVFLAPSVTLLGRRRDVVDTAMRTNTARAS